MTDVTIPEPGGTTICGTFLAGQRLCGQMVSGDSYADFPLALDGGGTVTLVNDITLTASTGDQELLQGTAEVLAYIVRDVPILVEISGYLDLAPSTATTYVERNVTVTVDLASWLDLAADPATVSTGVTLTSADAPLELDGGPITLFLDNTIRISVEQTLTLELVGGPVRVNPALMPEICIDLDLDDVTCTPLGLAAVAAGDVVLAGMVCTPLDLVSLITEELEQEPVDCLEA